MAGVHRVDAGGATRQQDGREAAGRRLAFAGSLAVILLGAFWFIQRVFFPGGIA